MVDLRQQYLSLQPQIDATLQQVLEQTHFIMGANVKAFEEEAAAYLGCDHAIGCANGTDALHLAMLALGIGPGDEVITTPFTFIATVEAIAYVGATPVFVDIDPSTYNIDINALEDAITDKTKALLPVHLFGLPTDMAAIQAIAKNHQLRIVEDCAQSFGATVGGKQTGTMGDIGCFSFFPSKNLGAYGDGGMVCTNDADLAEKCRMYRSHGSKVRYHHDVIGYNSRLDEMQAAVLRQKLPHIDRFNEERRRVAKHYCEAMASLPIQLPLQAGLDDQTESVPVFHQFTLLTDQRAAIQKALSEEQIASAIYYPIPLHKQKAIRGQMSGDAHCPISEDYSERCLSLPIYPELPGESIDRIVSVVKGALSAS
ncbi:MAG: DegT/DnrJ/EryC1/StrS family aminotransferase [Granulosicoccus sp.]|nr:DegT/DnrJ/EryC1/StrS family aminotransferase [Granulosicoccus sp.]